MATHPPEINKVDDISRVSDSGNGGGRNLVPIHGDLRDVKDRPSPASSTGIWVGIAAISMSFVALTSALVVRKGASSDWQHFTLPAILYVNTVVLALSSATLEVSRRRIAAYMRRFRTEASPARWLYVTLFLGLVFVSGQYVAWRQLSSEGLYLATNPSSSFFYVLTAGHLLHVLGGLGGLVLVIHRLGKSILRRSTLDIAARYWHFLGVLWLYLLVLLRVNL
jgi:cytochrome c oxidase subunit III